MQEHRLRDCRVGMLMVARFLSNRLPAILVGMILPVGKQESGLITGSHAKK